MPYTLPPHIFVQSQTQWDACIDQLLQASQVAIDLESNGLFAYREQICLIQLSTRDQDYIVDPLADIDLTRFGDLLEDPTIEKIFHASEYDLILLRRERDWGVAQLFDTMWAARVVGYEKIGLASMLNALYQIEIDKRYQRANWCERPLNAGQLTYAQTDTHFLFQMRDDLEVKLRDIGRWEETLEIFEEQSAVKLPDVEFTEESFWSINGVRDLPPNRLAILRELTILRDDEARRRNRPAFKVFSNKTLLAVADRAPKRTGALRGIQGLNERQIRRYGRQLVAAVDRGRGAPVPRRKRRPRLPEDIMLRYEALHDWRKEHARARGVASDVVMTRETLWEIAHGNPNSAEAFANVTSLGPVRRAMYSAPVLDVLANLAAEL